MAASITGSSGEECYFASIHTQYLYNAMQCNAMQCNAIFISFNLRHCACLGLIVTGIKIVLVLLIIVNLTITCNGQLLYCIMCTVSIFNINTINE